MSQVEDKLKLITRELAEVVGEEDIRAVLAQDRDVSSPRLYA
jgi:hypothetical protein